MSPNAPDHPAPRRAAWRAALPCLQQPIVARPSMHARPPSPCMCPLLQVPPGAHGGRRRARAGAAAAAGITLNCMTALEWRWHSAHQVRSCIRTRGRLSRQRRELDSSPASPRPSARADHPLAPESQAAGDVDRHLLEHGGPRGGGRARSRLQPPQLLERPEEVAGAKVVSGFMSQNGSSLHTLCQICHVARASRLSRF